MLEKFLGVLPVPEASSLRQGRSPPGKACACSPDTGERSDDGRQLIKIFPDLVRGGQPLLSPPACPPPLSPVLVPGAAVTNDHRLSGFNDRNVLSHSPKSESGG